MDFIKKFFKDENAIIGLCGFKEEKKYYNKPNKFSFNSFQAEKFFQTDFEKNLLLS